MKYSRRRPAAEPPGGLTREVDHGKHNTARDRSGGFPLALSRQIHDGRGAERHRGHGTRTARRSCLRAGGQLRWEGRERQEPQKMADSLRLPGSLYRASAHLRTTATLDRLRELYPKGRFEVGRFRPNIVLEPASGEKSFVESAWIGHALCIGAEVRLTISGPCPRCVMTTLPQGDLPKDPGILRTAAPHNQVNVGVYANVARGGPIRRGDPVRLE